MMGKQKGLPQGPCACTIYTGSVPGGNYHGVSRRRGWEVIYRLAVPTHLPTYLSMCTCHVHGCMFQIRIFTSETFISYSMPMPPFKCYYSMYYPYLGHCPKAFERPRSGLGHLCGIVFSLSSNPKQLLVHCLWALGTPWGFLPSPASLTLSFFSYMPAFRLLPATELWGAHGSPPQGSASPQWMCRTSPPKWVTC